MVKSILTSLIPSSISISIVIIINLLEFCQLIHLIQSGSITADGTKSQPSIFLKILAKSCSLHFLNQKGDIKLEIILVETFYNNQPDRGINPKLLTPISIQICERHFSSCGGGASAHKFQNSKFTTNNFKNINFPTKLSPDSCSAVILLVNNSLIDYNLDYLETLAGILTHFQSTSFLEQNPNYIILSFVKNPSSQVELKFFSNFKFIHTLSKYFITFPFQNSFSITKIVCLQQSQESSMLHPLLLPGLNLNQVNRQWEKIHKNLSNTFVETQRPMLKLFKSTYTADCNYLGILFLGDSRLCIIHLLSKTLGFKLLLRTDRTPKNATKLFIDSFKNSVNPKFPEKLQISNEIDNWQAVNLYRQYSQLIGERMEWISQGWMRDPLSFLLVINKATLSRSALYKPFDTITWILIVISINLVTLILYLSLWAYFGVKLPNEKWRMKQIHHYHYLLLMVIGSIIEQNPNERISKKDINSFRIVFGIWLLLSIIISNAYTGIVTSYLCSTILPSEATLPQNIEELIKKYGKSYPLLTYDEIYVPEERKMMHFTQALIYEYFIHSHISDSEAKLYYWEVLKRTMYLSNITTDKLIFAYDQRLAIPKGLISGWNFTSATKEAFLPLDFAYLSTGAFASRLSKQLKSNRNVMFWSPESKFEPISITTTFTVPRNYFSVVASPLISFIIEAGLAYIWDKKEEDFYTFWDSDGYECWKYWKSSIWDTNECDYSKENSVYEDQFEGSVHHHHPNSNNANNGTAGGSRWKSSREDEMKPLTVETLNPTLTFLLYGISVGLFVFILEHLKNSFIRRSSKIIHNKIKIIDMKKLEKVESENKGFEFNSKSLKKLSIIDNKNKLETTTELSSVSSLPGCVPAPPSSLSNVV